MKSVLISIHSEWCDKIASGEKTIEIRKSKPKLEASFKCYIYCTKQKEKIVCNGIPYYNDELYRLPNGEIKYGCSIELAIYNSDDYSNNNFLNGKVIGEFICDRIKEYVGYDKSEKTFYGWHISDLVIYDKPKELSEFVKPGFVKYNEMEEELCTYCADTGYGENAYYVSPNGPVMCEGAYCDRAYQAYLDDEGFTLYCPPQSWRYVDEVSE